MRLQLVHAWRELNRTSSLRQNTRRWPWTRAGGGLRVKPSPHSALARGALRGFRTRRLRALARARIFAPEDGPRHGWTLRDWCEVLERIGGAVDDRARKP